MLVESGFEHLLCGPELFASEAGFPSQNSAVFRKTFMFSCETGSSIKHELPEYAIENRSR
jgi:hypothetical protein